MLTKQHGFTLIEIMLAVAILAILSAIAVQAYEGYIGEARIGTAIKDIRQAELILTDLAEDNDLNALDGNTNNELGLYLNSGSLQLASTGTPPTGAERWADPWGNIYRYRRDTATNTGVLVDAGGAVSNDASNSSARQGYDLYSLGPDGVQNSDDIVRGCDGEFVGVAADHPTC